MITWAIPLVVIAALLGLLASTLHFALRDFSVIKLKELAGRNGGFAKLESIVEDSDAYAISMGVLRSIFVAAMIIGVTLLVPIRTATEAQLIIWLVAALAIAATLMTLTAVVIPVSLADHAGEWLIHKLAPLIKLTHIIFWPLRGLHILDKAVGFLAGSHRTTDAEDVEDEILSAASEGEREGSLSESERRMIEAVLELRSKATIEIMTPRTEMECLPADASLAEVTQFITRAGHSRIPVYDNDVDHILGVLYAKDLLKNLGKPVDGFDLRKSLRPALFVPENKPAGELLVELQLKKVHLAIVIDEYGGTTGLVTLEDIIEEIVGDIRDEYEPAHEREPAIHINEEDRSAEIEARANISDANRALEDIDLELPEADHYDTVGGYALSELGHIPVEGESFTTEELVVTVLESEPTRIVRLRIEPAAEPDADAAKQPAANAEDAAPHDQNEQGKADAA